MFAYRHRNFFALLVAAVLVTAALHLSALAFYLYWQWPWLDAPIHFLAGFSVALSIFAVLSYFGFFNAVRTRFWLLTVLIALTAGVGAGFEAFELINQLTFFQDSFYLSDTGGDLLSDVFGSSAAWWFLVRQYAHLFV